MNSFDFIINEETRKLTNHEQLIILFAKVGTFCRFFMLKNQRFLEMINQLIKVLISSNDSYSSKEVLVRLLEIFITTNGDVRANFSPPYL